MKKLMRLELKGEKGIKEFFLPIGMGNLRYEISLIQNEIGKFEVDKIEAIDKDYSDLEFSNIRDLQTLNNIIYMDKRLYSLLVIANFDMKYAKKILSSKQYIFLNEVCNDESLGKILLDNGFIGSDIKEHIILGYTKDGTKYNYNKISSDFKSKGMRILSNNVAVMILFNMDYKKYSNLLTDNSKDICELECTYTAVEIAQDECLVKHAEYGNIRKCSECGFYVSVSEFSGERDINEQTYYDICDRCSDMLEISISSVYMEDEYYEDILEESYVDEDDIDEDDIDEDDMDEDI